MADHAGGESTTTGVLVGSAAIVGAVVWFVVGLVHNTFYVYPPLLLVVGVVRVATAVRNRGG